MSKGQRTRMTVNCPIFGSGEDLGNHHELPTSSNVMKCYLYIRQSLKQKTNKDPSVSEIVKLVVVKLKIIWKKASIPIVSDQRIEAMLKNCHGKYRNLLKPLKGRQDSNAFSAKVKDFKRCLCTKPLTIYNSLLLQLSLLCRQYAPHLLN